MLRFNNNESINFENVILVIFRYKSDVIVITQDQGRAKVECNNNDIIQV